MENTAETEKKTPAEKKTGGFFEDIAEIIESTLITIFAFVMILTYILHPVNVKGGSMNPTLYSGDRIFMSTVPFGISQGDIIIIDNNASYLVDENGEPYKYEPADRTNPLIECIIKRVIAEGGQTIDIDFETGEVSVDGKVLDEPYINELTLKNDAAFTYPLTIPEGYYFVMGDNRNHSSDSRNEFVGLIKDDQIYGKAVMRYSPLSEFKIL